ncbi:hypothetical protein NPIL_2541 [Nephila pilipes]|uniref:Uncharacterized protein n=1 Tax=Nephila pilipes TaxID=299642 RepID=A0A8X6QXS3_NEPPI|nr:hypothetical protein NPIL_2541 [Nephila pilipes]
MEILMDCKSHNTSRPTTPNQDLLKETCETLKAVQRKIKRLIHFRDKVHALLKSNRRHPDHAETDEQFQSYQLLLSKAQNDLTKAEGEYSTLPTYSINGCPTHSALPIAPEKLMRKNNAQMKKDEEGYISPLAEKL